MFDIQNREMKLGSKIRRIRKLRGLTIEELAEKADLTKGFISQLERDLTVPSVSTLKQILDVLGVSLSSFFSDISERERNIFTKKDRTVEVSKNQYKIEQLIPKLKYLEMEPVLITLEPSVEFIKPLLFFIWLGIALFIIAHQIISEINFSKKLALSESSDFSEIIAHLKIKMGLELNQRVNLILNTQI